VRQAVMYAVVFSVDDVKEDVKLS